MSQIPGTPPLLRATNVHKSFGSTSVLHGVSLDVAEGEVCCVLGRSGSGKSTFLRCINQLEILTQGQIHLAGERIGYERKGNRLYPLKPREVARQRRDIGMVFQRFNLFPHLTVLENVVEAPIRVRGVNPTEAKARGMERLEQVGLATRVDAYCKESGNNITVVPLEPETGSGKEDENNAISFY